MSDLVEHKEQKGGNGVMPDGETAVLAKKKFPVGIVVVAVVVLAGIIYGVRAYTFGQNHATTDDAYITSDVVPITPRETGNVVNILVDDNQKVKKGDLLVQLDATTYQADYDQALANLELAKAQARSAGASTNLTQQTSQAGVAQAQGGLAVTGSDIATAQENVAKAEAEVNTAQATYSSVKAQAAAAQEAITAAIGGKKRLGDAVNAAAATLNSAQAAVRVAQANLKNVQATASNAARDAQRYRTLANEGAIAVSQAESKETASANAQAAVEAAQQQVSAADATVAQMTANLNSARQQFADADSAIAQARANATAAKRAATAQAARIGEANTGVNVAQQGVAAAKARQTQALGALQAAQTVPQQVSISRANEATALAKVKQAAAAVENARIALERTKIRAPIDGKVSRRSVQLGQQVSTAQPLLYLIPDEKPWIVANFKETQTGDLHPGQKVEVDVDAIPGETFLGTVDSVSAGTGATFALLPPDNATGNFTKVVQRVPVKIFLDPNQKNLDKLRAGLSVNVTVTLH